MPTTHLLPVWKKNSHYDEMDIWYTGHIWFFTINIAATVWIQKWLLYSINISVCFAGATHLEQKNVFATLINNLFGKCVIKIDNDKMNNNAQQFSELLKVVTSKKGTEFQGTFINIGACIAPEELSTDVTKPFAVS